MGRIPINRSLVDTEMRNTEIHRSEDTEIPYPYCRKN